MTNLIAGLILLVFLSYVAWNNVQWSREKARRRTLPDDVRKQLAEEDAAWMQRYSF